MRRGPSICAALAAAGIAAGCLGPPDESVPIERLLGPPGTSILDAPRLEAVAPPGLDRSQMARRVAYLRGYADGEPVWYWNVDGANARFIAPVYRLVDDAGELVGAPIIDTIPGDTGYTPWWRIHVVRTTAEYAGERIDSREAIDVAVQAGLLLEPRATNRVVNCPVVDAEAITIDPGRTELEVAPVWYRGLRATWILFPGETIVPTSERSMPIFPVYVLQRIDEALPLYEFITGVDVDGDARLVNSNNVFANGIGGLRYSPLWEAVLVRVSADTPSIDTSTTADLTILRSEQDLWNPDGSEKAPFVLTQPQDLGLLVNCPIEEAP